MSSFDPDPPLDTFLGGRYGLPGQGVAAHQWYRHPCIDVMTTAAAGDPGVEGMGITTWYDAANNYAPVTRIVTVDDVGTPTIQWIDKGGNDVSSQSAGFQAAVPNLDVETKELQATNIAPADPEYGRVRDVDVAQSIDAATAQVTATTYAYRNSLTGLVENVGPGETLDVTDVAIFSLGTGAVQVKYEPAELLDVTGAAAVALAAIPTFATYAEIYIDASADDTNIRWTQDATTPADDNGEQESKGETIILDGRDAIDGFRALTIGADGVLDPALTASLTVNYSNIAPDED